MRYYTTPTIGVGTYDDPIRPDVPDGTSWVGQDNPDGTYLIATPTRLPAKTGRRERPSLPEQEAARRGLALVDIERWFVR